MDHLPLLTLFTRLREAGFPLGIDDYQAALTALQAGFGVGDRAALARLCRTLWVKSEEEHRLFDYHFDRTILPEAKPSTAPAINLLPVAEQIPSDQSVSKPLSPAQIAATVGIYAFSVGIVVLPYLLSTLMGRTNHYPIFTSQPVVQAIYGKSYEYKIQVKDVDVGDTLTIEAGIRLDGQMYPITEQGIEIDKTERYPRNYSNWLRFKDQGNGTALLSGTVQWAESSEERERAASRYPVELRVQDQHGSSNLQSFEIQEIEASKGRPFHILWLLLGYAGLPVVVYLIYWRSRTASTNMSSGSRPAADLPTAPESTAAKDGSEAVDKARDVSAALQLSPTLPTVSRPSFRQTSEYFPLTRRQMKQSWRFLRRMVRTGTPTELDIEATLDQISRQGICLEPVLVPRRVNQSRLLLLIDQDGSMVPFHGFSELLAETAMRGGRLENANVYYFHNCPMDYLYGDRYFHQAEIIDDVLNTVQSSYTGVLIFSDAGAARSALNAERLDVTTAFLTMLKQRVRYIAWLNPVPSTRWTGTTANQIAQVVPMFELNRRGLDQAISILRGRFR
jgi:uncharacterized protein with von Willebrand factor type A (vWA) domain